MKEDEEEEEENVCPLNLSDKWGINKMILLHRVTESFAILTKRDMCKGQVLHYMHHSRPLHLTN